MIKLFRITTVPLSLQKLISGQLPFMRSRGFEPLMLSADGPEAEAAKREQKSPLVVVPMTRKVTPVQDLKSLWAFYKLCKKHKPQIIHSHTPKAGIVGMLGGKLAGVPIRLHTVAGLPLMEATGTTRRVLELVEKITYACATKVYPNSINLKEFILESGFCGSDKVKVIGNGSSNGINTGFFSIDALEYEKLLVLRQELNLQPEDFVFVFVGRLVKDKGVKELIAAFKALQVKHSHLKLLLVGPLEQDLDPLPEETLQEIAQNSAILSVGYQNDVRPYLAISQALAFPSYREGFPNVPMQAGCFNLPSVVTDINGCNEIIADGENGLIIPPKNTVKLQKAMERLVEDKQLYAHLKSNARKMIVARYDQQHFWELLYQEYQEQLEKHEVAVS
ncbi:glycosyltransferase family 4 protein [Pontibacter akesuensis]|uniref:Glycosyltransferase involved in cell wall bisynthesis n=1 Tax=Pontibacter akesuensis TaxID=388950 RepID=A0A1I7H559_9BACT|nr:glycosyltransferase family 4 protein [Pontibacter akesuensis]GHA53399.1 glycosyl transferase [Pontibacter akesuensis]SFU55789.1 Glycosyltransferase involved in cell wall bisynthesis [Pontibacter akesuensis]